MALTVWRVTPMRSASCCCVISACLKRSSRMLFRIAHPPMSEAPAVEDNLTAEFDELGDHNREEHELRQCPHVHRKVQCENRDDRASEQDVEGHTRRPQIDEIVALVARCLCVAR